MVVVRQRTVDWFAICCKHTMPRSTIRRFGVVDTIQDADSHRPLAALCLIVHRRVELILDVLLLPEESECVPCLFGDSNKALRRSKASANRGLSTTRTFTVRLVGVEKAHDDSLKNK